MRIIKKEDSYQKIVGKTVLVYGLTGTGKTTLINTLPFKKILVIDFERKAQNVNQENCDFLQINDWSDMRENRAELKTMIEDYDCVVVDSLTELRRNYLFKRASKLINGNREIPDMKQTLKLWGYVKDALIAFIEFLKLTNKPIYFIALALTNEKLGGITTPDLSDKLSAEVASKINYVVPITLGTDRKRSIILDDPEFLIRLENENELFEQYPDGKCPADLSLFFK